MSNWDSPTPSDIMKDFEALLEAQWRGYSVTAMTCSGPAWQLRLVGFDVPAEIEDDRFVTVVCE